MLRDATFSEVTGWGRFLGVVVDRAGDVWFGRSADGGGVYRFDGVSFERYGEGRGLGSGGVIDVSVDREGNVWAGTTSGVFRFDGQRFVHFGREN